ncbi:hypothetical protein NEIG_01493 [Nematocida sp. ERTm5]|nr:hypothetical protein NEIRO02_1525 [Nematocida sp. AWRm79]KAI5187339.1 hypothetical protein NEIRO03_2513 [Nematocida sp. AWRm78]KAI5187736.1 hypothetical protein NEIRO03_2586 [Nematocida sp. AWRm78]OAG33620.1 hypothetical protein NEIG_01493 [Nematocida sp. ERTm5]
MTKEIQLLLKETKTLLQRKHLEDNDNIHSKLLGLYLYLHEYTESDRESLVNEYNELVDKATGAGISKLKKIKIIENIKKTESIKIKKREEIVKGDEQSEKLAMSILDHSKILKKKAENFGQMLENSKKFVDNVSTGVRDNVKQVQKGVLSLESKEWYNLSTGQVILLLLFVILIFIIMYFIIRIV